MMHSHSTDCCASDSWIPDNPVAAKVPAKYDISYPNNKFHSYCAEGAAPVDPMNPLQAPNIASVDNLSLLGTLSTSGTVLSDLQQKKEINTGLEISGRIGLRLEGSWLPMMWAHPGFLRRARRC